MVQRSGSLTLSLRCCAIPQGSRPETNFIIAPEEHIENKLPVTLVVVTS